MSKRYDYDKFELFIIDTVDEQEYHGIDEVVELLNYYDTHLQDVLKELYCKDRVLEEYGLSVECCDNKI